MGLARRSLQAQLQDRGTPQTLIDEAEEVLRPDALTIGFGRRFATYKSATLLLHDPMRLARILNNPERPIQIIFAGKAHPRDQQGRQLIQAIIDLASQLEFRRKVVFLETMTCRLHAIWCRVAMSYQHQVEAETLYELLEREIVPAFYDRRSDPRKWIERMKNSITHLCPEFNMHRMVMQLCRGLLLGGPSEASTASNRARRAGQGICRLAAPRGSCVAALAHRLVAHGKFGSCHRRRADCFRKSVSGRIDG